MRTSFQTISVSLPHVAAAAAVPGRCGYGCAGSGSPARPSAAARRRGCRTPSSPAPKLLGLFRAAGGSGRHGPGPGPGPSPYGRRPAPRPGLARRGRPAAPTARPGAAGTSPSPSPGPAQSRGGTGRRVSGRSVPAQSRIRHQASGWTRPLLPPHSPERGRGRGDAAGPAPPPPPPLTPPSSPPSPGLPAGARCARARPLGREPIGCRVCASVPRFRRGLASGAVHHGAGLPPPRPRSLIGPGEGSGKGLARAARAGLARGESCGDLHGDLKGPLRRAGRAGALHRALGEGRAAGTWGPGPAALQNLLSRALCLPRKAAFSRSAFSHSTGLCHPQK